MECKINSYSKRNWNTLKGTSLLKFFQLWLCKNRDVLFFLMQRQEKFPVQLPKSVEIQLLMGCEIKKIARYDHTINFTSKHKAHFKLQNRNKWKFLLACSVSKWKQLTTFSLKYDAFAILSVFKTLMKGAAKYLAEFHKLFEFVGRNYWYIFKFFFFL